MTTDILEGTCWMTEVEAEALRASERYGVFHSSHEGLGVLMEEVHELIEAAKEPQNWMIYSGTYNAWRYSPLDQVNQSNVT